MEEKNIRLYSVRKDVKCLDCNCKGAIQYYGRYYPKGVGDVSEKLTVYEKYRNSPYLSKVGGIGGTVPHECINCGNVGLIDEDELEGYKYGFATINK